MLGVLSFVEDPDLSWTGGPVVPQLLPPWQKLVANDKKKKIYFAAMQYGKYYISLYETQVRHRFADALGEAIHKFYTRYY